jgi:hypothetical protein
VPSSFLIVSKIIRFASKSADRPLPVRASSISSSVPLEFSKVLSNTSRHVLNTPPDQSRRDLIPEIERPVSPVLGLLDPLVFESSGLKALQRV